MGFFGNGIERKRPHTMSGGIGKTTRGFPLVRYMVSSRYLMQSDQKELFWYRVESMVELRKNRVCNLLQNYLKNCSLLKKLRVLIIKINKNKILSKGGI